MAVFSDENNAAERFLDEEMQDFRDSHRKILALDLSEDTIYPSGVATLSRRISQELVQPLDERIPIKLSLRNSHFQDGSVSSLQTLLQSLPNPLTLNISFHDLTDSQQSLLLQGAGESLVELHFSLKNSVSGEPLVLHTSCPNLRILTISHAEDNSINVATMQKLCHELQQLPHIQELYLLDVTHGDGSLEVFVDTILTMGEQFKILYFQYEEQCISSRALPQFAKLLRDSCSKTSLRLYLGENRNLFGQARQQEIQQFLEALYVSSSLKFLGLEEVGLESDTIAQIILATESLPHSVPELELYLRGDNIFGDETVFGQLTTSLERMRLKSLWLHESGHPDEWMERNDAMRFVQAFCQNVSIESLNAWIRVEGVYLDRTPRYQNKIDKCLKRNKTLNLIKALPMKAPTSFWAHVMAASTRRNRDGFLADSIFWVLRHKIGDLTELANMAATNTICLRKRSLPTH